MTDPCQYREAGQLAHVAPATHMVVGMRPPLRWGLFLALPEKGDTPTYCLRHGMDVMEERNHQRKEEVPDGPRQG